MGIIFRLGVWLRYLRIVVSTVVPKVLEYSSMAAPIYASWGIDTDTYYGKKILTMEKNSLLLFMEYDG
jgi:hypothetical protein